LVGSHNPRNLRTSRLWVKLLHCSSSSSSSLHVFPAVHCSKSNKSIQVSGRTPPDQSSCLVQPLVPGPVTAATLHNRSHSIRLLLWQQPDKGVNPLAPQVECPGCGLTWQGQIRPRSHGCPSCTQRQPLLLHDVGCERMQKQKLLLHLLPLIWLLGLLCSCKLRPSCSRK
jgi:hypothetical protein